METSIDIVRFIEDGEESYHTVKHASIMLKDWICVDWRQYEFDETKDGVPSEERLVDILGDGYSTFKSPLTKEYIDLCKIFGFEPKQRIIEVMRFPLHMDYDEFLPNENCGKEEE